MAGEGDTRPGGQAGDAGELSPGAAAVVRAAPYAVALIDTELRYLACSRAWATKLGRAQEELVGVEVDPSWRHELRRCLRGESWSEEAVDDTGWWRRDAAPVEQAGQVVAILVHAAVRDDVGRAEARAEQAAVERLRLEEELEHARAALKRVETAGRLGHWWSSTEGERGGWSPVAAELLGSTNLLGGFRSLLDAFDERSAESLALRLRSCVQQGEPLDLELTTRAGGAVRVLARRQSAPGGEKRLEGVVVDVKAAHELTERMRRVARLEAVGRLAEGVAHDFNNLLSVVTSFTEMCHDEVTEPALRDDLAEVLAAARRAAVLTRQLLSFTRREPQEARPVDVYEVLQSLAKMARRLVGENVTFEFRREDPLGKANVDVAALERTLLSLVACLRDEIPATGAARIVVTCSGLAVHEAIPCEGGRVPSGNYVHVALSVPIRRERMVAANPLGPGLGVQAARSLIESDGGFMRLTSGGVELFYPWVREVSSALHQALPARSQGATILVAEDDVPVRQAVCRVLRRDGLNVLSAGSAEEAVELAAEHATAIDLLLTDLVMPGASGFALAHNMRRNRPAMRVLYMTGYAARTGENGEVVERELMLHKPFGAEELVARVRSQLVSA